MRRQATLGWILVGCLMFLLCANTASGQAVYGNIIGTVTDPQGNAVVGAKVTVTSATKNTSVESTTNESGNFSVIHLIPDNYKVRIEAPGFQAYDVASVLVATDDERILRAVEEFDGHEQQISNDCESHPLCVLQRALSFPRWLRRILADI